MGIEEHSQSDAPKFVIEVLSVPVTKFRSNLSQLLDELGDVYKEITLTKNGKIVAHILPPKYLAPSFKGSLKGIIHIPDGFDIDNMSAVDGDWEEQLLASWERVENNRDYVAESHEA